MKDEEKLETFKKSFKETAYKISGMPFELPLVHIHQDTMPTLDHSKDSFEYSIKFIVQRLQEQINEAIIKNIRQIMKEKGVSEYYAINEKRLLEIVEEAKAFELIKDMVVLGGTNLFGTLQWKPTTAEQFEMLKRLGVRCCYEH